MEISSKNISSDFNIINFKGNGLICFKQNWCKFCKENIEPYKQAYTALKPLGITLFSIEGTDPISRDLFASLQKKGVIKAYPSIFYVKNGKITFEKYKGQRTYSDYYKILSKTIKK